MSAWRHFVSLATYSALLKLIRLHLHICVSWSRFTICLIYCVSLATNSALQRLIRLHLHILVSWSRFTVCMRTLCIPGYLQCPAKTDQTAPAHLCKLIKVQHLHIRVSWSTFTVCLKILCIPGYLQCPAKTNQIASAHPCMLINIHCLPEDTLYPWLPKVLCKDWSGCTYNLVSWSTFTVCLNILCILGYIQCPAMTDQTAPAYSCKLIMVHCLP